MGRQILREVSLAELVSRSPIIVVATPGSPAKMERAINFDDRDGKAVPPYQQSIYRFRVSECLRGDIAPENVIDVIEADSAMQQHVHYRHYAYNMDMTFVVRRYMQQCPSTEGEPEILFLRRHDGEYAFHTHDSYEGIGARAQVQRMMIQGSDLSG